MSSTHTVTPADSAHLVQFIGTVSMLFGLVTLFDPANLFVATLPLVTTGGLLAVLPFTPRFRKLFEQDPDAPRPKKNGGGENGENRQARRRKARRERKFV